MGQAEELFASLDSIARLDAILAIETAFGIDFSEDELGGLRTFADLAARVEAKHATRRPAAESPAWLAGPLPPVPSARWNAPASYVLTTAMRLWYQIRVTGHANLPPAEACLLCANHASHLDSLLLLAASSPWRERLVFAAAKDYFFSRSRFAGWSAQLLPMIPWERGGDVVAMRENLRQLAACHAAGRIIVFFPEGGRSSSGQLQPFKEGLSFFAGRLNLPVVPCWLGGTHRALPKGARWPRPGRLSVSFGEPLRPRGNDAEFTEMVRTRMLALRDVAS